MDDRFEHWQCALSSLSLELAENFIRWWIDEDVEFKECRGRILFDNSEYPEVVKVSKHVLAFNFFTSYSGNDPVSNFSLYLRPDNVYFHLGEAEKLYQDFQAYSQFLKDRQTTFVD